MGKRCHFLNIWYHVLIHLDHLPIKGEIKPVQTIKVLKILKILQSFEKFVKI
jgi:hypothetical protein